MHICTCTCMYMHVHVHVVCLHAQCMCMCKCMHMPCTMQGLPHSIYSRGCSTEHCGCSPACCLREIGEVGAHGNVVYPRPQLPVEELDPRPRAQPGG